MIPGWLRYGDLPPAGNFIALQGSDSPPLQFAGYRAHWVQSGTAALALALLCARQRQPQITAPTVILPAYGCPDLIAAAEYAGVRPLLVDISVDDPGYDLEQLAQAIDATTVAVVAVNFLGIRERLVELRAMVDRHAQVLLIEDNAQWFPEPADGSSLAGDLVCLSFGRGKPVSLLGGGLLLVRSDCPSRAPAIAAAHEAGAGLTLKVQLFNALLHRRLYPIVNRNPLFALGQTVFKPLHEIRTLDRVRYQSVATAVQRYLAGSRSNESAWEAALGPLSLPGRLAGERQRLGRLLRYPILCVDENERNRLWRIFDQAGLGASALYRVALPDVDGVAGRFRLASDYGNARNFSARLLTLPVHEQVTETDIGRAVALLS